MADPIYGVVVGDDAPTYVDGATSGVCINARGDMRVAQSLPSKAELARLGDSWYTTIPTGSAYTNVADMPTTRAELALYNGDAVKSYVIDSVWITSLTSITAISAVSLIYQVASVAALTDNTAVLISSPLGLTYGGRAKRALAVTTMTANKWGVLACAGAQAAVSIGSGVIAEVNGGIIVRPGYTLGINAVVGTATGTTIAGIAWHEVELPN